MTPAASLVCRVEKHKVAGQGGLDGELGGLFIADLTHHDDIRVLAQSRAQAGIERVADLRSDLGLADAFYGVFDRILQRQDVVALAVHFREQGIEGRGFSGACGPRDEDHAVRLVDGLAEHGQILRRHGQLIHGADSFGLIQYAHLDLLAVVRGKCRHAEVDTTAVDPGGEASVLRLALLVQAHGREDFDAGDYGGMDLRRQDERRVQDAVDAEADADFVPHVLDMNIGGLPLHGIADDCGDDLYHRSVLDDEGLVAGGIARGIRLAFHAPTAFCLGHVFPFQAVGID